MREVDRESSITTQEFVAKSFIGSTQPSLSAHARPKTPSLSRYFHALAFIDRAIAVSMGRRRCAPPA
ncbi:MAG: hypothetical protein LYZ66_06780 [Nitrososphaerales archaeon]|nr:hypothetical protein [Nitrososphaerales archaeon]